MSLCTREVRGTMHTSIYFHFHCSKACTVSVIVNFVTELRIRICVPVSPRKPYDSKSVHLLCYPSAKYLQLVFQSSVYVMFPKQTPLHKRAHVCIYACTHRHGIYMGTHAWGDTRGTIYMFAFCLSSLTPFSEDFLKI